MNTKTLALGLCLALATTAGAQNKQGGISAEMLQNIEKTQKATTTADKALFNALASNKIDDLAKNFGNNRYTNDTSAWRQPSSLSITRRVRDAAGCSQASTCCAQILHATMATR